MEYLDTIIVGLFIFFMAYPAAFATYYVSESDMFDLNQQRVIYAIAWLIPVIGPALIISIIWSEIKQRTRSKIPLWSYLFLAAVLPNRNGAVNDSDSTPTHNNVNDGGDGNY